MKILSNTDTGGRVVEFSRDEFQALYALARSCDPSVEDIQSAQWKLNMTREQHEFQEINNFDFTLVFENVRAFRDAQFNINKLQNLLNGIQKAVKINVA